VFATKVPGEVRLHLMVSLAMPPKRLDAHLMEDMDNVAANAKTNSRLRLSCTACNVS